MFEEKYPKWNPGLLKLSSTDLSIAIVASRYAGKSTFLEWLWRNELKQHFDIMILFTDNPQAEAYDFLTEKERRFVFPKFEDQIIKDLDYFQFETKNLLRIAFIFDDCSMHNKQNAMLQQLFIRGRNIRSTVIFSTQYHLNLSTAARANLDWLVLLNIHGNETKRKVTNVFLWDVIEPRLGDKRISMKKQDREDYVIDWLNNNTVDHSIVLINLRDHNAIYAFKTPFHEMRKEKRKKARIDSEKKETTNKN